MQNINEIKTIIEFVITLIIGLASLVLLVKIFIIKKDKNKNGKLDAEEITDADTEFCKNLLKDSIKTIALGIYRNSNMTAKQVNNMLIEEVKKSKTLVEETIKKEKGNNEKNC